jgi:hypothetical protein
MGLDTPKRPEVKVKVPKLTKVEVGEKRPDTVRQMEAKQELAKKTLKKLPGGKKGGKKEFVLKGFTPEQRAKQKKLIKELVPDLKEIESEEARKRELDKAIAGLKKDFQKWEKEGVAGLEEDFRKWEEEGVFEKEVKKSKKKKVVSENLKKRGEAS